MLVLLTQVLELQQNLAVSVSTERKKDLMIEQLDKVCIKLNISLEITNNCDGLIDLLA